MQHSKCLWHPNTSRNENIYVVFQSEISVLEDSRLTIRMFGSNAYQAYLDGKEIIQGPARFDRGHPEYDEYSLIATQGSHVFSVMVHYFGVSTRFAAPETPPFLQCEIEDTLGILPIQWMCKEINAFKHIHRRLNVQLGWMELCDTRLLPNLESINSGEEWVVPIEVVVELGKYRPKSIADCHAIPTEGMLLAKGVYTERFGYLDDDPPLRFMLRDIEPSFPPEGLWFRFDLGRIGLYRTTISLDVPEGTIVEAGYSESLTDRRVIPFITLSASTSCNMDRWIAKGGEQVLQTFSPRGFRFMEIHIAASSAQVKLVKAGALQRTYFDIPKGSFHCSDDLLNEIWMMGVRTLQACSEDALTDTPTRERGQWLGDAVAVGLETLSVSFGDLSLIRRGLVQASHCRSDEGMVSGLYPGQNAYLSSYAFLWVSGCLRYYWKTGDRSLLVEVYETAVKTMDIFNKNLTSRGVSKFDGWDFLDWGHHVEEDHINVSLNLLMLGAQRDLAVWEQELGLKEASHYRTIQVDALERIVRETYVDDDGILAQSVPLNGESARNNHSPGYHATVLALWFELLEGEQKTNAVEFVKRHMLNCFPNDHSAPRLSNPSANNSRLITPYYSHFALHALWEAGEADFVLEQYRVCWGWMKELGATTLLEVFDPRWSHCHAWSGCPTWQLSGHLLGLLPDDSGEPASFYWNPKPGSLEFAEGTLPLDNGKGHVYIKWVRSEQGNQWDYELRCDRPIHIRYAGKWKMNRVEVDGVNRKHTSNSHITSSLKLIFQI